MDCVATSGDVCIGYDARLAWKSFGLSYASTLELANNAPPSTRTALGQMVSPVHREQGIVWNQPRLAYSGQWQARSSPLPPLTLYQSSKGSVVWHCIQPLCSATVQHNHTTFTGLGYVERLEMSLPPWHLPMQELHWGRFLAPDVYLVWIQWRGAHPLTLVYFNGQQIDDAQITPFSLTWNSGSLALGNSAVLRNGPLINTALSGIPGLRSVFPRSLLHTNECKWRSSGELLSKGQRHTGWAIHEVVHFYRGETP